MYLRRFPFITGHAIPDLFACKAVAITVLLYV